MKYYLIAGEASGDLHASNLMRELEIVDGDAEFRFFGGDKMKAVGGTLVKHYRELAYMGFIPVLMHLPQILNGMKLCKQDILSWAPDVVILVDYPGFNLDIAKFAHENGFKVFYYISPKIWAWKEYRIKQIRAYVDELFSILPFEVEWFAQRNYDINYVGNPCVDAVAQYQTTAGKDDTFRKFCSDNTLFDKPIIAVLAGSRRQEIKDNLGIMLEGASRIDGYQLVIAGAPNIDLEYYRKHIPFGVDASIVFDQTYRLLTHASAAVVTSGTATLETAILRVPQVVCYYTPIGKVISWLRRRILKVPYISLVNLIAGREVVQELVADRMTRGNVEQYLRGVLPGCHMRDTMLSNYDRVNERLGAPGASRKAAECMVQKLKVIHNS